MDRSWLYLMALGFSLRQNLTQSYFHYRVWVQGVRRVPLPGLLTRRGGTHGRGRVAQEGGRAA